MKDCAVIQLEENGVEPCNQVRHDAGLAIPVVAIFISSKQPNSTMTLLQRTDIIRPITTHHSHVTSASQVRNSARVEHEVAATCHSALARRILFGPELRARKFASFQ